MKSTFNEQIRSISNRNHSTSLLLTVIAPHKNLGDISQMQSPQREWLVKKWPFRSKNKPLPQVPAGTRIFAIGDIHGRIDLLDATLSRIDDNLMTAPIERALHIFVGDYVDRGPNSSSVIDRLIERSRTHEAVCLKGNHESFVLEFMDDPSVLSDWRQLGGIPTLISYGLVPKGRNEPGEEANLAAALRQAMPDAHRDFLKNLRTNFTLGDYYFAHAGVRPGISLANQKEEDLLWIRDEFLASKADFGKVVVHGHTPVEVPDVRKNRINIDTGAYASGNLTCLVLEGETHSFL